MPTPVSGPLHNAPFTLTLAEMRAAYVRQGNPVSAVTDAFWSDQNLQRARAVIEATLTERSGFPVGIEVDEGFYLDASRFAAGSVNRADVPAAVAIATQQFIAARVKEHMLEIGRRQHFVRLFINNDRLLHLDRPRNTNGRHRVVRPTTEPYYLENPHRKEWARFQQRMGRFTRKPKNPTMFRMFESV